ncbi:hypothetical protein SMD22_01390 (plasmid) [Brevibacillus halotolerans]|nr:hypothetical protein SMD22_01390 [Brevibacillus halotolerans]
MVITMTRYKRSELEMAVKEKLAQGWICISGGIHEVGNEKKLWDYEDGKMSKYCGRSIQKKYMVKMKSPEKEKTTA